LIKNCKNLESVREKVEVFYYFNVSEKFSEDKRIWLKGIEKARDEKKVRNKKMKIDLGKEVERRCA